MAKVKNKVKLNLSGLRKGTQTQLAAALKTNSANISRWENGEVEPDLANLIKIAQYFNVTTDYLLGIEHEQVKTIAEFTPVQQQIIELLKKLNDKQLDKVYNYLVGFIDASN